MRKTKIESNRKYRKNSDFNTNSDSSSSADFSLENGTSLERTESFGDFSLDEINPEFEVRPLKEFNDDNKNEISPLVYRKAVELEFTVLSIARPITDHRHTFNELEGYKLSELLSATSIIKTSSILFTSKANNMMDVCRQMGLQCEQEIRKFIKMSKRLTAFNSITESDRLVLMKYSSLGLFCMRSIKSFDYNNEYLTLSMVSSSIVCFQVYFNIELMMN